MKRYNVAIIMARMGSSRLPGKVLKNLVGRPMLAQLINRIKPSKKLDKIVVSTSIKKEDDPINEFCDSEEITCFRGDSEDVLKRLHDTAEIEEAKNVITIMGDNPLLHYDLIDAVVDEFHRKSEDYCTNYSNTVSLKGDSPDWGKFPEGVWAQICSASAIQRAFIEARDEHYRLHAMTYIFSHRNLFGSAFLFPQGKWSTLNEPDLFLAVNTPQQFVNMETVFEAGLRQSELFDLHAAIKIVKMNKTRA